MPRSWLLYLDDLIERAQKIGRSESGRTAETLRFVREDLPTDPIPAHEPLDSIVARYCDDAGIAETTLASSLRSSVNAELRARIAMAEHQAGIATLSQFRSTPAPSVENPFKA